MAEPTIVIEPPEAAAAGCSATIGQYDLNFSYIRPSRGVDGKTDINSYTGDGWRLSSIVPAAGWEIASVQFVGAINPYDVTLQFFDSEMVEYRPPSVAHYGGGQLAPVYAYPASIYGGAASNANIASVTAFADVRADLRETTIVANVPWGDNGTLTVDRWYYLLSADEYRRWSYTLGQTLTSIIVTFRASACTVSLKRNPDDLRSMTSPTGSVTGGGVLTPGTSRTVTASANAGYRFLYWSRSRAGLPGDADFLSYSPSYTFTVPAASALELWAHFDGTTPGIVYNPLVRGNPIAYRPRRSDDPPDNPYPIIARF